MSTLPATSFFGAVLQAKLIRALLDNVDLLACLSVGHWKLGHTPRNFILAQVVTLAQMSLFTFTRTAPGLFESFGFIDQKPIFVSIMLFQLLLGPVDEASDFVPTSVRACGKTCGKTFFIR